MNKRLSKASFSALNEAEQLRFEAQLKKEPASIRIRYGLSELDVFTNEKMFWDYHIKLPFKVKKGSKLDKTMRERIQNAWKIAKNL